MSTNSQPSQHNCRQCGKDLGYEWLLGPVCGACCRKNHQRVAKGSRHGYITDEHAVQELRAALMAAVQDLEIVGEIFRVLGKDHCQSAALDHVPLYKSIIEQYAP